MVIMNLTENKAFRWLTKEMGYGKDDIIYQGNISPDFITKDGHSFEVKKMYGNKIIFYDKQVQMLTDDTSILIFKDDKVPIVYLWRDLKGKKNHENMTIIVEPPDHKKSIKVDVETWHALMRKKIQEGWKTFDEILSSLLDNDKGGIQHAKPDKKEKAKGKKTSRGR